MQRYKRKTSLESKPILISFFTGDNFVKGVNYFHEKGDFQYNFCIEISKKQSKTCLFVHLTFKC